MNVSSIATFSIFPRASIIWSLQYTAAAASISFGLSVANQIIVNTKQKQPRPESHQLQLPLGSAQT